MLDVQRRVHGDAGVEQLEHVLPPLGVPGFRRVGVGELVDEDHRGPARERRVEIEFPQRRSAVGDPPLGEDLEALEERFGLGSPVCLDVADDDVHPFGIEGPGGLEHGVGLAHSGGGAEEEHEMPAPLPRFLLLDTREQGLGVRAVLVPVLGHGDLGCLACLRASSRPRIDAAMVKVRASVTPNP